MYINKEELINRIVNREVTVPIKHGGVRWQTGYAKCQFDILDIIEGMETYEGEEWKN